MLKRFDYWVTVSLVLLLIGGAFYWYEFRLQKIHQNCNSKSESKVLEALEAPGDLISGFDDFQDFYDYLYSSCLREQGLQ